MQLLDLTLPTPAENVALDEALLEESESNDAGGEILRIWESTTPAVIIGRSSRAAEEVNLEYCRQAGIPILRRCSGGAAVMIGPGCLMYAIVLRYQLRPHLHLIDEVHRLVLGKLAEAVRRLDLDVSHQGISDLALAGRKVSGNSLRSKRRALLYHGTLLYDFPLDRLAACLRTAPRQPEYRAGRGHREFVTNLPRGRDAIREALRSAWPTGGNLSDWPKAQTQQLVLERYARDEWNLRL